MIKNELVPVAHNSQLILTTQQIAEFYETDIKIISNNYNRNKERYTEGKHYYCLEGEELRVFKTIMFEGWNRLQCSGMDSLGRRI